MFAIQPCLIDSTPLSNPEEYVWHYSPILHAPLICIDGAIIATHNNTDHAINGLCWFSSNQVMEESRTRIQFVMPRATRRSLIKEDKKALQVAQNLFVRFALPRRMATPFYDLDIPDETKNTLMAMRPKGSNPEEWFVTRGDVPLLFIERIEWNAKGVWKFASPFEVAACEKEVHAMRSRATFRSYANFGACAA